MSSHHSAIYSAPAERSLDAMFDAVLGYRVRRATHIRRAKVTDQTATRDLAALASAGPHDMAASRFG
jgi:hypothetical protein